MKFRLGCAQFLAATYGSCFDPEKRAPLHVLAENFSGLQLLKPDINIFAKTWVSDDTTAAQAMTQLREDLGAKLGYDLMAGTITYLDVFDDEGNVIRHLTIVWPYQAGKPIVLEQPNALGALDYGMVACLLLMIEEI